MATATKEAIVAALQRLDRANDNHWTTTGDPRVDTVRILAADGSLTREDIAAAAPDFKRQVEQAAPPAPAPAPNATANTGDTSNTNVSGTSAENQPGTSTGASTVEAKAGDTTLTVTSTPASPAPVLTATVTVAGPTEDELAVKARNLVVTSTAAETYPTTGPGATLDSDAAPTAFETAKALTGREVGGGFFTGHGDQKAVLGADDNLDLSDESVAAGEAELARLNKRVEAAKRDVIECQGLLDRIYSAREAAQPSDGNAVAMQAYKVGAQAELEEKATRQRAFGAFAKDMSKLGLGASPLDSSISAANIANRRRLAGK